MYSTFTTSVFVHVCVRACVHMHKKKKQLLQALHSDMVQLEWTKREEEQKPKDYNEWEEIPRTLCAPTE